MRSLAVRHVVFPVLWPVPGLVGPLRRLRNASSSSHSPAFISSTGRCRYCSVAPLERGIHCVCPRILPALQFTGSTVSAPDSVPLCGPFLGVFLSPSSRRFWMPTTSRGEGLRSLSSTRPQCSVLSVRRRLGPPLPRQALLAWGGGHLYSYLDALLSPLCPLKR